MKMTLYNEISQRKSKSNVKRQNTDEDGNVSGRNGWYPWRIGKGLFAGNIRIYKEMRGYGKISRCDRDDDQGNARRE